MIKSFNYGKTKESQLIFLLDFIKRNFDYDFYYTSNNQRIYFETIKQLKQFLKESVYVYVEENIDYEGIITVWKSTGGNTSRYYIKLLAINNNVATRLLTIMMWNFNGIELFVKIRKNSRFMDVFKSKSFDFKAGRGRQLLMAKKLENRNVSAS